MTYIYFNGTKLLNESDKQPNWNLLTETSQDFQNVTIPKNTYFTYITMKDFKFPVTLSVYIKNPTNYYLIVHMSNHGNDQSSNRIEPHSEGKIIVSNTAMSDSYYVVTNQDGSQVNTHDEISFQAKELKLERGSVATDWMPAIQDLTMKSDFDTLKAKVDQLTKNQNGGGKA